MKEGNVVLVEVGAKAQDDGTIEVLAVVAPGTKVSSFVVLEDGSEDAIQYDLEWRTLN